MALTLSSSWSMRTPYVVATVVLLELVELAYAAAREAVPVVASMCPQAPWDRNLLQEKRGGPSVRGSLIQLIRGPPGVGQDATLLCGVRACGPRDVLRHPCPPVNCVHLKAFGIQLSNATTFC